MSIDHLIGLPLESCSFSKGSYTFEFSGVKNGKNTTFRVGTSYNLASRVNENDVLKNFSVFIWPFLEQTLAAVEISSSGTSVTLKFENGKRIVIWGEEPVFDNLLIVRNPDTGAWFTVA